MKLNSSVNLYFYTYSTARVITLMFDTTADSPPYSASRIPRHFNFPSPTVPSQDARHSVLSYFNYTMDSNLVKLVDTKASMKVAHTNCSLPQKTDNCSFVQFEALLNLADRTICKCDNTRISVGNKCSRSDPAKEGSVGPAVLEHGDSGGVSVFAVTPTYTRYTQKVDLTSLCYTLQHVANLIWIVVEDAMQKTSLVSDLLQRCKVSTALYGAWRRELGQLSNLG